MREWRITTGQSVQRSMAQLASWPEEAFIISTGEGIALEPNREEAFATIVARPLDQKDVARFQWTFTDGFLMHKATGLVLHATDDLINGSQLQLRNKLTVHESRADKRQLWTLKTDGSITSESHPALGLGIVQQGDHQTVQLAIASTCEHYRWSLFYGKYTTSYNEEFKRDILIMLSKERIALTTRTERDIVSTDKKLVTVSYGLFPRQWFYIRSKQDASLVVTSLNRFKGASLTFAKIDTTIFRRQLWRYRDDGCLANLASDYVIDIAGGSIIKGGKIIQWSEKFFSAQRKNQLWGLSVEGHIHPKIRPSLTLGARYGQAVEGAQIELQARGALTELHQQFTFATPVFGKRAEGGVITDDAYVESVGDVSFSVSSGERYENIIKRTVVRRWGLFPSSAFFIRCSYGSENLAMAVQNTPTQVNGETAYEVALHPVNFKEYKYFLWTYKDGHLINVQTGLALDSQQVKGQLLEDGLKSLLYVRAQSESENQYWSLTVDGEIHQRSDIRRVLGTSAEERCSVTGAQLGLQELRVRRVENNGKKELSLDSKPWLRWNFSTPVYGVLKTAVSGTLEGSDVAINEGESTTDALFEGFNEESLSYREQDESDVEGSDDEEEEEYEDEVEEVEEMEELETVAQVEEVVNDKPLTFTRAEAMVGDDYTPIGSEKIVHYTSHLEENFPQGYFLIKSGINGYVLDVSGEVKEGAQVVLTRIKTTDFASQLWTIRNGSLVNLKNHNVSIHVSETTKEQSARLTTVSEKQAWVFTEHSIICQSTRTWTLTVKASDIKEDSDSIEVFVQEKEKTSHGQWEVLVPGLIPDDSKESDARIVRGGKVAAMTSSASAVLAFKWLKETYEHKLTVNNQWPSSEHWFFIRHKTTEYFLAAGENNQIVLSRLNHETDEKRFLWVYVQGYLVNYKYMLRLVLTKEHQWVLSSDKESCEQVATITSNGQVSIQTDQSNYLVFQEDGSNATSSNDETHAAHLQLHVPVYGDQQVLKSAQVALTTVHSWARTQRITTTTTTTTTTTRRGVFPSDVFFIKVQQGGQDYALTVGSETESNQLVLKKLSFKDFKTQLWSHRSGLLINYGSKFVIDVQGAIDQHSSVVQSAQTSVSSQKWLLTVEGQIQLESYRQFFLGYTEVLETTPIQLTHADKAVTWTFSVPIFGRKTTTGQVQTVSEAIEQGAEIESLSLVEIKIRDYLKPSTLKDTVSHVGTGAVVGVVGVAAGVAGVTVGVATKFGGLFHHSDADKLHTQVIQPQPTSAVLQPHPLRVSSERSTRIILSESRTLIRAWQISFTRRLQKCTTKESYIQVIESSREELYASLDQYRHAHTVAHEETAQWQVTLEQVKEVYRARVFETLLERVQTTEGQINHEALDLKNRLEGVTHEIDQSYKHSVQQQETQEVQEVEKTQEVQEKSTHHVLATIDTIRVSVRYWLIGLGRNITHAKERGASQEEIQSLIQTAKDQLNTQLTQINSSVSSHVEKSKVSTSKTVSIEHSVEIAIQRTKVVVFEHIESIQHTITEQSWLEVTQKTDEKLTTELKECQLAILQEVSSDTKKEETVSVAVTDKVAQQTVETVLVETKTRLVTWHEKIMEDLTYQLEEQGSASDTLVIVDAARVNAVTLIEEATLVLRTYHAQLTYLSVAERRRFETSLEQCKSSILASLYYLETMVKSETSEKKDIHHYLTCSFGSVAQKNVEKKLETIVSKVTVATQTHLEATKKKADEAIKKVEQVIVKPTTPKQEKKETPISASTAASVASVIAGVTVSTHRKNKDEETKVALVADHQYDSLVFASEDVKHTVSDWLTRLTARVSERAKQGGDQAEQDIAVIVTESREALVLALENVKRSSTHTVFSETIQSVRTLVWTQSSAIKVIGIELAKNPQPATEIQLQMVTESTVQQVHTIVTTYCTSVVSQERVNEIISTVASGNYQAVDYTTFSALPVDKANAYVVVAVHEASTMVNGWFEFWSRTVTERIAKGGDNVQADVAVLIQQGRERVQTIIKDIQSSFDKYASVKSQLTETETILLQEAQQQVTTTFTQIQESVLVKINEVETINSSETVESGLIEKIHSIVSSTKSRVENVVHQSETTVRQHLKTVSESTIKHDAHTTESKSNIVKETSKHVLGYLSGVTDSIKNSVKEGKQHTVEEIKSTEQAVEKLCEEAKTKASEKELSAIESIKTSAKNRLNEIKVIADTHKEDHQVVSEKLNKVNEETKQEIETHCDAVKTAPEASKPVTEEEKHHHEHLAKKVLLGSAAIAAGTGIALKITKKLKEKKQNQQETGVKNESTEVMEGVKVTEGVEVVKVTEQTQVTQVTQEQVAVVENVKTKFSEWLTQLNLAVSQRVQQSNVSKEEITLLVEESRKSFQQVILQAKSNESLQYHQRKTIVWIEQTVYAQTTRIVEIVTENTHVESRLEALTISTTQEVTLAVEKCKHHAKAGQIIGATLEFIREKEYALLEIKHSVATVVETTKQSLTTYFQQLNQRIKERVIAGGENVRLDLAILITEARTLVTEEITKAQKEAKTHLRACEEKTYSSAVVISSLTSVAMFEIHRIFYQTEKVLKQKVDHIETCVSLVQENDSNSSVIEQLEIIEEETNTVIQKTVVNSNKHLVASMSGTSEQVINYSAVHSVQEMSTNVHTWLRVLTEKVSLRAKIGGETAAQDIQALVAKDTALIYGHLEVSRKTILQKTTSSEEIEILNTTISKVKTIISVSATQVQTTGVKSVDSDVGGIEEMITFVASKDEELNQVLSHCESKVTSVVKTQVDTKKESKVEFIEEVKEETKVETVEKEKTHEHLQQIITEKVSEKVELSTYAWDTKSTLRQWLKQLVEDISTRAKKGGDSANQDIEVIFIESNKKITETLAIISAQSTQVFKDQSTAQQFEGSITWTKGMVLQAANQVKAVGLQAVATGSKAGGVDQMNSLVHAIQTQVEVELGRYKLEERVNKHKENKIAIVSARKTAHQRNHNCKKSQVCVSELLEEYQVVTVGWLSHLIEQINTRREQGEENIEQDIQQIVDQGLKQLSQTAEHSHAKIISSISSSDEASKEAFVLIKKRLQESFSVVQKSVSASVVEIQQIAIQNNAEETKVKLSHVLEKTQSQVVTVLTNVHAESTETLNTIANQSTSAVTIVDTVDYVKKTVSDNCLDLCTSISEVVESSDKESRVLELTENTKNEVVRIITEAKEKVVLHTQVIENKQDVVATLTEIQTTVIVQIEEIKRVGVESNNKHEAKLSLTRLVTSTREKIDTLASHTNVAVLGVTAGVLVGGTHVVNEAGKWVVDVHENATVFSEWLKHVTDTLHETVLKGGENVTQDIEEKSKHAEQEITEIIQEARTEFYHRLSEAHLDKASMEHAREYYDTSMDAVARTVKKNMDESKKISIHTYATGQVHSLKEHLENLVDTSRKSIKSVMSHAVITEDKTQISKPTIKIDVEVESNVEVVDTHAVDVRHGETVETVDVTHSDKVTVEDVNKQGKTVLSQTTNKADTVQKAEQGIQVTEKKVHLTTIGKVVAETKETKVFVSTWLSSLIEKVKSRVQQGGDNVKQDTLVIIQKAQEEAVKVIETTTTKLSATEKTTGTTEVKKTVLVSLEEVKKAVYSHTSALVTVIEDVISSNGSVTEQVDLIEKASETSHVEILEKLTTLESSNSRLAQLEKKNEIVTGAFVGVETKKEETQVQSEKTEATKTEEASHISASEAITGALAIGAATAIATSVIKHNDDKKVVVTEEQVVVSESAETIIEKTKYEISQRFSTMTTQVIHHTETQQTEQVTTTVETYRKEVSLIIENAKTQGAKHCCSKKDEEQYVSMLETIKTVTSTQSVEVEKVAVHAIKNNTDVKSQLTILVKENNQKVSEVVEQIKSRISFVSVSAETASHKVKQVVSVIEAKRVAAIGLLAGLTDRIQARVRLGGNDVRQDILTITEETEREISYVLKEGQLKEEQVEGSVNHSLATIKESITAQLNNIREIVKETLDEKEATVTEVEEKISRACEQSKSAIETTFTHVTEKVKSNMHQQTQDTTAKLEEAHAAVVTTTKQATETIHGWYSHLKTRLSDLVSSGSEDTKAKAETIISEAQVELKEKIEQLKTQTTGSIENIDVYYGQLQTSATTQLEAIRTEVSKDSVYDKVQFEASLEKTQNKLHEEISTHTEAVKEKSKKHTFEKVVDKVKSNSAATAAATATAIAYNVIKDQKNKKEKKIFVEQKVQVVEESTVQQVQTTVNHWFASLTEKISVRTQQGGDNVKQDVVKIVDEAHQELDQKLINFQSSYTEKTEDTRSFYETVEWIRSTTRVQMTEIKTVVIKQTTTTIDIKTQIENMALVTKKQVEKALAVHCIVQSVKTSGKDIQVVSSKTESTVVVVQETKEQVKERTQQELSIVVEETKQHLTIWLETLQQRISTLLRQGGPEVRQQVLYIITEAEKEKKDLIQEAKLKFVSVDNTSAASHTSTEITTLVSTAHSQALECLDSINTTVTFQMTLVNETISRIDVEEHQVIEERLSTIVHRTKERVHHILDHATCAAIEAAFEGKTTTWVETAELPASFKDVRAIAFDVVDTVVDYRKTLLSTWKQILINKKESKLNSVDFESLVVRWYAKFVEYKKAHGNVSDEETLRITLNEELKADSIECRVNSDDVDQLITSWSQLHLFSESTSAIHRLKKQSVKFKTVAISDTFSTASLVDFALNGCLCWHAQFTTEMFNGSGNSAQTLVEGTRRFLGLKGAEQLAVVSADPTILEAARQQGSRTVFVKRGENVQIDDKFDITVDGLDIFAESVQTLLEHQTTTSEEKTKPVRSWFQRVVAKTSDVIGSKSHH
ncbi:hypothetical protein BDF14DRAFT_87604 [Spinellus fusiger]|nr:hypothetical protein BDF14DRAFT_87604 [Spinellus fusiger]